jgi:oligoribonuclease NrnB/cAMP/cGMP phosphodiesterase (DHH superfamily)
MAHPDFHALVRETRPKKVLLVHHWDTDGLASAALLLDAIAEWSPATQVVLMHPTINNYFLTMTEYEYADSVRPDLIVVVDLNFPLDVFEQLEKVAQVFVFDHHVQTAKIDRPGLQSVVYPGCSMLLNDYLMKPLSLVGVMGMVGDQEDRIKDRSDFYPQVEEMMKQYDVTFDEILWMTKFLDTMYMIGDDEGLVYAIELLRTNPAGALTDERLLNNHKELSEALNEVLSQPMQEIGPFIRYLPIQTDYSLTSEVTRAKSRQYPDEVIITDQVRGEDATLYVRRRRAPIDLSCVVDLARKKGFNAGGKPEVAGVVLPSRALDAFRQEVVALLMKTL